jgi:hypothetical protein
MNFKSKSAILRRNSSTINSLKSMNMGYYFIADPKLYDKMLEERNQMLWVGDDALEVYHELCGKKVTTLAENVDHQMITYDRLKNEKSHLSNHTVLNEVYPLWSDDYNLAELESAFDYLHKEYFKEGTNDILVVGNPGELIVQSFIRFLSSQPNDLIKSSQIIFLSDPALKLVYADEIKAIEDLIAKNDGYAIEVDGQKFDWTSFFKSIPKKVKKTTKKNFFSMFKNNLHEWR